MGALPNPLADAAIEQMRNLLDYLPARMVNEFAYCPRLFFYEWVEGLFAESVDTVEGKNQHQRVDEKSTDLPEAGELAESVHARFVTLSSERLRAMRRWTWSKPRPAASHRLTISMDVPRRAERPGTLARGQGATRGSGNHSPGKRISLRGRDCLLSQDWPGSPGDAGR